MCWSRGAERVAGTVRTLSSVTRCNSCGSALEARDDLAVHGCHQCTSCGLIVTLPLPEQATTETQYLDEDDSYFRNLDGELLAQKVDSLRPFAADIRKRLGAGTRVFEIGSGTGAFVRAAVDAGLTATGSDISPTGGRIATEVLGVDVAVVNANDIKIPDGAQVVVAMHVVEHLLSPRSFLERVRDQLQPGAWLIVEVPDFGAKMREQLGVDWPHFRPGEHLYHFEEASLGRLLTGSGFRPRRTERLGGFGLLQPGGTEGVADPGDTPRLPGWRQRVYESRTRVYRVPGARRAVQALNSKVGYGWLHRNQSIRVWAQAT